MKKHRAHVVIVEDEVIIALDIKQCLGEFGYAVDDICANTKDALNSIETHKPDVVLMDIILEDGEEGTQIVNYIQEKLSIPVIYVTSHSDEETLRKAGITKPYGYIIKPVDENQLHSAIQIALFKSKHELQPATRLMGKDNSLKLMNGFTYDVVGRNLFKDGKPIVFTRKEREFVALLMEHMNTTLTYDTITEKIWKSKHTNTANLRSLVRRVREKTGEDMIENITSVGYRICVQT
ncbi:MAG: response regulator transcription factor [Campylobacteraceae bacterium]|nr:response regulator transcription factor [Campylobacteraceae bacterium]